jgi:preprotein translocase subunit YajC
MSEALYELIFWIVVFMAFFYGFRWLQRRKRQESPSNRQRPDTKPQRDDEVGSGSKHTR